MLHMCGSAIVRCLHCFGDATARDKGLGRGVAFQKRISKESFEILPGIRYSCVLQCVVLQCVVLQCLGSGLAESSEILPGIRYLCVLQCVVLQCAV